MLKWNLGWVMGKIEPMESLENWINGKFASLDSKCRKVTTHKCPCMVTFLHLENQRCKFFVDSILCVNITVIQYFLCRIHTAYVCEHHHYGWFSLQRICQQYEQSFWWEIRRCYCWASGWNSVSILLELKIKWPVLQCTVKYILYLRFSLAK